VDWQRRMGITHRLTACGKHNDFGDGHCDLIRLQLSVMWEGEHSERDRSLPAA